MTYGFDADISINARDRDTSFDRHIAGTIFNTAGTKRTFRVDLPAVGSYTIRAAFGDGFGPQAMTYVVKDGTTATAIAKSAATPSGNDGSGSNLFFDASGGGCSVAGWPTTNTAAVVTMTGTALIVELGDNVSARAFLAHLQITQN